MALSTELSGVQAAQTDIDTIGNNISNINTVGFKQSLPNFADLYGSSLQGASGNTASPGQGVTTTSLSQLFSEGTVSQTGNPLDIAINGNGFFQLQTGSGIAYSRDGAFQLDKNGHLVNDTGATLMGNSTGTSQSSGGGSSSFLTAIQVNESNIPPTATTTLSLNLNLAATTAPIDTTTTPFSLANAASYNQSTTTTVYDSLGVSQTMTSYFTEVSGSGSPPQWATHYALTNTAGQLVASGSGPSLSFNTAGQLTSGSGTITINNLPDGAAPLSFTLDFTGSTVSNVAFGVNSIGNNGNGGGQFTGIQIAANGQVSGQYSNGDTKVFGTIALANFANPQGLIATSDNLWLASVASGLPTAGNPGSAGLGQLQSGSLEGSNVDLSSQLVNLIVAQQAYQANVQGINVEQQDIQRLLTIQ
ncbi:MAG TPA: flagellar hook protein FlgE [Stellaceae bacterium]|nr:flagellar hook protein FlgE [Stellaceae bacterium]